MSREKNIKILTKRHLAFVSSVFDGLTGEEAYRNAFGDDENSAKKASALLSDPLIKKSLRDMSDIALEKEKLNAVKTRSRILRELENIAFADIKDFYPLLEESERSGEDFSLDDIPKEKRGAISSVTKGKNGVTVKLNDKFKAIELLEKELSALEGRKDEERQADDITFKIKVC